MLHLRLASAATLVSCMVFLIVMDYRSVSVTDPSFKGGLWLIPAGLFFVAGTSWEFARLVGLRWTLQSKSIVIAACSIFLSSSLPVLYPILMGKPYPRDCPLGTLGLPLVTFLVAMSYFSVWMLIEFPKDPESCLGRWALSSLIPAYVGFGASFWVFIRWSQPGTWSLLALVGVIAIAKFSDAGAYFVGRSVGRRKLWPAISPGKTWEGAIGGLMAAMLASFLWFSLLLPWLYGGPIFSLHSMGSLGFGLLLAVVGMLGDLVESVVKRVAGSKDSGSTLPGLGGIWDVTDSLLPTAVAGFLGIVAGLVWTPALPA